MSFREKQLQAETERLLNALHEFEYSKQDCEQLAEITLAINRLKKEKNAIVLAHSYQTPDIKFTVADFVGDSYGLSLEAKKANADIIVFSSVLFMGETAKILNPNTQVLVPARAGCSLADSITAEDVQQLRKKYPHAGFVAYINTTAEVKAEVDAVCTSGNAERIVEAMEQEQIVFLPDRLMGENLKKRTSKELILWDGVCIVHEEITRNEVKEIKAEYPNAEIIAHPECDPNVIAESDYVGSTEQMLDRAEKSENDELVMLTECGLAERVRKEYPKKKIVGTCHICPYMKQLTLRKILDALQDPKPSQIVDLPKEVIVKAQASVNNMFKLEEVYRQKFGEKSHGWKN